MLTDLNYSALAQILGWVSMLVIIFWLGPSFATVIACLAVLIQICASSSALEKLRRAGQLSESW